jgi:tRNA pseudouridine32 synthase/23S rRNA pseudouridine746 synthase
MDTSGIMLLAKDKQTHKELSRQFQQRLVQKQYQAICKGIASQKNGCINLPMRCDWENRPLQIIDFKQGKYAQTYWQIQQQNIDSFKVLLTPITGRSHQLRLHMKQLGHPILGDNLYFNKHNNQANRLFLHSFYLTFLHPIKQEQIQIKNSAHFWHI